MSDSPWLSTQSSASNESQTHTHYLSLTHTHISINMKSAYCQSSCRERWRQPVTTCRPLWSVLLSLWWPGRTGSPPWCWYSRSDPEDTSSDVHLVERRTSVRPYLELDSMFSAGCYQANDLITMPAFWKMWKLFILRLWFTVFQWQHIQKWWWCYIPHGWTQIILKALRSAGPYKMLM